MTIGNEEQIKPEETAVLVIDVQNDFCHPNGALWRTSSVAREMDFDEIIGNIERTLEEARTKNVDVIFIQTVHSEWTDTSAWKRRKAYDAENPICLYGTWGAELYRLGLQRGDLLVTKNRYSAFLGTNLDLVLRSRGIRNLALTGFMANVCVEATARDAFQLNYLVYLLEDCVGAATKRELEGALLNIGQYFGCVLDSVSFLGLLE